MQAKLIFSLMVLGLLASGCVSKGAYDKLQEDSIALRQSNDVQASKIKDLESTVTELQTKIQDEQAKIDSQSILIADLQAKLGKATSNKAQLDRSLAETKQALKEMMDRKAQMEKQLADFRSLTDSLKSLIDTGDIKIHFVKGRMVVSLGSDVLFQSGSARLSPQGEKTVRTVTTELVKIQEKDFQVEGHTDNVPIHTKEFPSNWQLAAARAINVVNTMIDAGMPATRISAASYGENEPTASNDTPDGRAQNRRIDVVVLPDLSKLLNVESLERSTSSLPPSPAGKKAN